MPFTKLFSVSEAQSMLATIKPLLAELVRLKRQLDDKGYDVFRHQYFGGMGPNGQKVFPNEMERLVEITRALNEDGIEIKDLNRGLIDFPHKRISGDVVYLCYRLGEEAIEAWHPIEGGFAARRPLSEL
jgi:hypothetical protein